MTLGEYIKKRNGVAMGDANSLRNNLYRSLGAKNFATFWQYWNPIFGYYLGRFIFKPIKRFLPPAIALLLTFIVCGIIHDVVTRLFRGSTTGLFTIWFLFMGMAVLVTQVLNHNFSRKTWFIRALINSTIIVGCLAASYLITRRLETLW